VQVDAVQEGAPADGRLQPEDVLTSVDGEQVEGSDDLRGRIAELEPGTVVEIGYLRAGEAAQVELTTVAPPSGDARSIIGVQLAEVADYPFEVTITLKDVGGPSAGLMFALGILDKLEPGSLTGGLYIAGTGEISTEGESARSAASPRRSSRRATRAPTPSWSPTATAPRRSAARRRASAWSASRR
jgi:PDZ domain-containing protein